MLTHGYTAIPSILIRAQKRLGINSTQFNILIQLLEYWQDPTRKPFPRKKEIAERIGINEKTVQVNVAQLEKAGLVHREKRRASRLSNPTSPRRGINGRKRGRRSKRPGAAEVGS